MTTVAVLAGTGKTGRAVCAALAGAGAQARPIGRAGFADLATSLAGADAVHLIAPNLHPDEAGYVATVLLAAARAGIDRIVYHSVAAPYAPAMPHHLGKAAAEDVLRRSGTDWTILQPCAYVQNFVPALLAGDQIAVPYDVHRRFGLVDLADVAAAAAVVHTHTGHAGAGYELGGPEPVCVADVAEAASRVLGRPVTARRTDPDDWEAGATALDPRERAWLRAMFDYYDAHGLPTGSLPLQALLGRPATSLDQTLARELWPGRRA